LVADIEARILKFLGHEIGTDEKSGKQKFGSVAEGRRQKNREKAQND
jgi:hypothetical protein